MLAPKLIAGQQVTTTLPAERGADPVTVSFAAIEAGSGLLVSDLRSEDVTLKIDGRSRPIRSLQLVTRPVAGGTAATLPPPFGSNHLSSAGRHVELIMDDESFPAGGEQPLRDAVTRLIPALHPQDRLSLVTIPHGGVRIPRRPTTRESGPLKNLVGRGNAGQTGSDLACRTRDTLHALTAHLSGSGMT